jgi:hypothetical protein
MASKRHEKSRELGFRASSEDVRRLRLLAERLEMSASAVLRHLIGEKCRALALIETNKET